MTHFKFSLANTRAYALSFAMVLKNLCNIITDVVARLVNRVFPKFVLTPRGDNKTFVLLLGVVQHEICCARFASPNIIEHEHNISHVGLHGVRGLSLLTRSW